jgi:hypothetical protein
MFPVRGPQNVLHARLASSDHVAVRKAVWSAVARNSLVWEGPPERLLAAAEGRLPGSDPDERRWAGFIISRTPRAYSTRDPCYHAVNRTLNAWIAGGGNIGGNAPLTTQEQEDLRTLCDTWRKEHRTPPAEAAPPRPAARARRPRRSSDRAPRRRASRKGRRRSRRARNALGLGMRRYFGLAIRWAASAASLAAFVSGNCLPKAS